MLNSDIESMKERTQQKLNIVAEAGHIKKLMIQITNNIIRICVL